MFKNLEDVLLPSLDELSALWLPSATLIIGSLGLCNQRDFCSLRGDIAAASMVCFSLKGERVRGASFKQRAGILSAERDVCRRLSGLQLGSSPWPMRLSELAEVVTLRVRNTWLSSLEAEVRRFSIMGVTLESTMGVRSKDFDRCLRRTGGFWVRRICGSL